MKNTVENIVDRVERLYHEHKVLIGRHLHIGACECEVARDYRASMADPRYHSEVARRDEDERRARKSGTRTELVENGMHPFDDARFIVMRELVGGLRSAYWILLSYSSKTGWMRWRARVEYVDDTHEQ